MSTNYAEEERGSSPSVCTVINRGKSFAPNNPPIVNDSTSLLGCVLRQQFGVTLLPMVSELYPRLPCSIKRCSCSPFLGFIFQPYRVGWGGQNRWEEFNTWF